MKLSYAIEQRMRFIDFLLARYGTIQRSAIMDYFGMSEPQASKDLGQYMELAPGNMAYDLRAKTYRRCNTFQRVWE
jgi:hypothetical protein